MNPRPEPEVGNSNEGLRFEIDPDGVGLATFDDPARGQNVLTIAALETLDRVLAEAEAAAAGGTLRALMFRSAKPGSFIAGVDVNMIAGFEDASRGVEATRQGQALFDRIAAMPVPTVAAIRGICLGGGTELALACDYRVADDGERTRIGLPEVLLGILPALGGTTRLPRLVGLSAALDLMLTGKAARVSKAYRIGLIDRILPRQQFEERALELARRLARGGGMPPGGRGRRRTLAGRLLDGTIPGRALILRVAARQVRKRTGGHYPAPLRILDVARRGVRGSVAASLEREARAFGGLIASPECKNLLFVFRMRERARKAPWSDGGRARPVGRIAVLGAGPMGGGIAQVAAYNGFQLRMKDIRHEAVAGGLAHARSIFDGAVRRRSLRKGDANARMGLISGGIDYAGVGSADLVVEAVVERMAVKHAVLREVEGVVGPDAVIATNTSSLSVDEMAQVLERPERFAGMHFFNPVHRMPLVEVVRGADTSADAVETLAALAVRLGKISRG